MVKQTPLYGFHKKQNAHLVSFAGYLMPLRYGGGIIAEHNWTRSSASFFDVSHMGQIRIAARSGSHTETALELETLMPCDLAGLAAGAHQYGALTSEDGGILDDVMIGNCGDHFLAVVNASRKQSDLEHMALKIGERCAVALVDDRAMIALQGPKSAQALSRVFASAPDLRRMRGAEFEFAGERLWVSRTGYSGEDGYEISISAAQAERLAVRLAEMPEVKPAGLGARDSLRLEAGLCLYGHDIDDATSLAEAGLAWTVGAARRPGGARPGGYPGEARIVRELASGAARLRLGLRPAGRAPMREGTRLYAGPDDVDHVGRITSGGYGPTVGGPVSMGYVEARFSRPGTRLFGEVRGRRMPVETARLPFVTRGVSGQRRH